MIIGAIIILVVIMWLMIKYKNNLLKLIMLCFAFLLGWVVGYFVSAALSIIGAIGANWEDAYIVNLVMGCLVAFGLYKDMREYPEEDW